MKKTVKIMPYIGIACALLSVIILPLIFSMMAVIFGAYSYYKGEKKGIIPIVLGFLLTIVYVTYLVLARLAGGL